MNLVTVFTLHTFILLHYFLIVVQSAPVSSLNHPPLFREAAESAKMLVEKVLEDIVTVHAATVNAEGLTLEPSAQMTTLQMMATTLGIPPAPVLKPLSERFTLDSCLSRMLAGSQLYQGLMGVLSSRLSGLSDLQADLRDLQTSINEMKEVTRIDDGGVADDNHYNNLDLASHLHGNYEVQVAAHLTLVQLRSFCHDLIRSLRAIATYRPRVVGAR